MNPFVILRVLAGLLFAVSGFIKLIEPHANFLAAVESFEVVGENTAHAVATYLPWVEFITGVFLIAGLWTRQALAILWILCSLFLAVTGSALARGLPITECGCFGEHFSLSLKGLVLVDAGLWIAFAALMYRFDRTRARSLDLFFDKL